MGTAEGTAGLGDFRLLEATFVGLPFGLSGHAVRLPEPTTEVDGPTPRTAEWEFGPFLHPLPFHPPVAKPAAYPNPRFPSRQTWDFSRRFSRWYSPTPCRTYRLCRWCPSPAPNWCSAHRPW